MGRVTLNDISKYIAMIRINFENAYKVQTDKERELLASSWYEILKDYPKEVCDAAVMNAIRNSEFPPRISSIVKEIENMQVSFEKSEGALWAELERCLHEVDKCVYRLGATVIEDNGLSQGENARARLEAIFSDLSPELREYYGNASGLIEVSRLTEDQMSYEKARFCRAIPTVREKAKRREAFGGSFDANAFFKKAVDRSRYLKGDGNGT